MERGSLIAPTSKERIGMIAKEAEGFLYCVSSLGVIGVRSEIKTKLLRDEELGQLEKEPETGESEDNERKSQEELNEKHYEEMFFVVMLAIVSCLIPFLGIGISMWIIWNIRKNTVR